MCNRFPNFKTTFDFTAAFPGIVSELFIKQRPAVGCCFKMKVSCAVMQTGVWLIVSNRLHIFSVFYTFEKHQVKTSEKTFFVNPKADTIRRLYEINATQVRTDGSLCAGCDC
jgi:hypothetical protein